MAQKKGGLVDKLRRKLLGKGMAAGAADKLEKRNQDIDKAVDDAANGIRRPRVK